MTSAKITDSFRTTFHCFVPLVGIIVYIICVKNKAMIPLRFFEESVIILDYWRDGICKYLRTPNNASEYTVRVCGTNVSLVSRKKCCPTEAQPMGM